MIALAATTWGWVGLAIWAAATAVAVLFGWCLCRAAALADQAMDDLEPSEPSPWPTIDVVVQRQVRAADTTHEALGDWAIIVTDGRDTYPVDDIVTARRVIRDYTIRRECAL